MFENKTSLPKQHRRTKCKCLTCKWMSCDFLRFAIINLSDTLKPSCTINEINLKDTTCLKLFVELFIIIDVLQINIIIEQ